MRLRQGGPADLPAVLETFDSTVAWLAAHGRSGQWGDQPWSRDPARIALVEELVTEGLWVAEIGDEAAGFLTITEQAPDYAPPVAERELYVRLLLVSRAHAGKNVGGTLLALARRQAHVRGIGLLRVDCWAGGDGALVRYYERQGFTPVERVPSGDKEVQVFRQRV
ncbi:MULTISPECIES: GNAT family N-acetyltransferase [Nocardiopsis]|uniref:GNAT family N-acetyltransferase n=1 Tax=Nocardiopsis sinuspersici TaxID=501010 RepID=A0A1V3C354_9ACTN|nr:MULTISPECIES: GNAT family N-acetyltransferase [Nocardiopsis]NYH51127.1 GNAT superfamily N-acetyltransferase [Nocardiopsis sinuspersici]OOC54899.1 GNAT family N-acetyltransferase [Nocardiopsis sinuspersici]